MDNLPPQSRNMPPALRAAEAGLRAYASVAVTSRGSYRLIRALRGFYPEALRSGLFHLPDGARMELDLGAYPDCTMAFGLYELETVKVMRRLLQPGDTFIDGGANIGYFSTLATHWVGTAGAVHAFEPFPPNRIRLEHNVRATGATPIVRVHAQALSDRSGQLHLHMYTDPLANHGQATAYPGAGQRTNSVIATAGRLDDLLPGIVPRLVKLDVEGSELAALQGMAGTVRRAKPALIIEFNATTFRQAGTDPMEVVRLLTELVPEYGCWVLRWPLRRLRPTANRVAQLGEVNLLFELPSRMGER